MKPVDKLQADRQRHAQAVESALQKTTLLKDETEKGHLLGDERGKDAFVNRVFAHHDSLGSPSTSIPLQGTPTGSSPGGAQGSAASGSQTTRRPAAMLPPTQTLLEKVKAGRAQDHQTEVTRLHAERAALIAQYKKLEQDAEAVYAARRANKQSLQAALKDDERLENLGPKAVLREFVAEGRTALDQLPVHPSAPAASGSSAGASAAGAGRGRTVAAVGARPGLGQATQADQRNASEAEGEEESDEDGDDDDEDDEEEDDDDDDDEEEEEEGDASAGGSEVPGWQRELDALLRSKKHHQRGRSGSQSPMKVPITQAETTGNIIKMLRSGALGSDGTSAALSSLITALQQDVPEQEEALHALRLNHQVATTRLNWARHRPATYERTYTASVHQKAIKQLCVQQVDELIEMAWATIRMRPTKEQVQAEIQEWKANHLLRLHDVARHVADSVLKDCVDEIIAEVSREVTVLHSASEGWADDMLVEAVATVMGGMAAGGGPGGNSGIRTTLLKAAAEHEAAVAQAQQARQREVVTRAQAAAARQRSTTAGGGSGGSSSGRGSLSAAAAAAGGGLGPGMAIEYQDPEDVIMQGLSTQRTSANSSVGQPTAAAGQGGAGGGSAPGSQRTSDARDSSRRRSESTDIRSHFIDVTSHLPGPVWNPSANQLPPRVIKPDGSLGDVMEVGAAPSWCEVDTLDKADSQQHYLLGLKAILHEMRRVRGSAVYGHTQKLTLSWPAGLNPSQAQQAAADAAVPPLAASLSVWRSRSQRNQHKCGLAVYPKVEAIKLSMLEVDFWSKVSFKPFFLGEKSPLVWVGKHLGHITCLAPSPQGTCLAVGTEGGAVLVYDLRGRPSNPWFQVVGDAGTGQLPKGAKSINLGQPLMSLTWSSDGYQLAAVDAGHRLRLWWMRPAPGQKVGVGEERQPVVPQLITSVAPQHMATSGKAPLEDALEEAVASGKRPAAKAWPLSFAHDFTLLGTQPAVFLPQVTGDVLKLTTRASNGPVLPTPLPKSLTQDAGLGGGEAAGNTRLQPSTANYLLSAQASNGGVSSQCLYRSHDSKVVFIGYLNDATTLVTLDTRGVVHLWRCHESQRTGMGWFRPSSKWVLPTSVKAYQPRGQVYPVWPTTRAASGQPLPASGGFLSWLGFGSGAPAAKANASQPPPEPGGPPPPTFQDYVADPQLHDTQDEVSRLRSDPQGSWLAAGRLPWLVRYVWDTEVDKQGRLLRQEIKRPHPQMGADKPLLVSCFSVPGGSLISRSKQSAVLTKQDFQVVSAGMNDTRSDLVVWLRLISSPGAALKGPWSVWCAHVIHMNTRKPMTPRIEVYDHSNGTAAPAWALTPPVTTLGSEYLCVGLGGGVLGMYSVATGQLVRELQLGMPATSTHFTALALFEVHPTQGTCPNQGKMLLAAVPSGSLYVHLYNIDDQVGTLDAVSRRPQPPLVRVLPQPGPQRPPSGPPHPGSTSLRRQTSLPAATSAPGHTGSPPHDQIPTESQLPTRLSQQQPVLLPPGSVGDASLPSRGSYDYNRASGSARDSSRALKPSGSLATRDSQGYAAETASSTHHTPTRASHTSVNRLSSSPSVPSPGGSAVQGQGVVDQQWGSGGGDDSGGGAASEGRSSHVPLSLQNSVTTSTIRDSSATVANAAQAQQLQQQLSQRVSSRQLQASNSSNSNSSARVVGAAAAIPPPVGQVASPGGGTPAHSTPTRPSPQQALQGPQSSRPSPASLPSQLSGQGQTAVSSPQPSVNQAGGSALQSSRPSPASLPSQLSGQGQTAVSSPQPSGGNQAGGSALQSSRPSPGLRSSQSKNSTSDQPPA